MTRRELNLAIFEGTAQGVLWQPRLETWINHHQKEGTLPDRYKDMDDLGIYDALRCSVRYAAHAGIEVYREPDDVQRTVEQQGSYRVTTIATPSGSIRIVEQEVVRDGQVVNRRIADFPVKTLADLRVAADLIERQQYRANPEAFRRAAERVGHRAEPTIFLNGSGFTDLIKQWCGLLGTYYLLADHPAEVEAFVEACDRRDDRQITEALKLPCRIFNVGDHANNEFTPPPILKRYLLPRWRKISARLGAEGRFAHSHWDGNSILILPYLQESGLHGVEALPPLPLGDMTLEEIKAAVGDRIVCLDLLPAIHFLPHYSMRECLDFTRRVIDMFAPRLILGISDEISEVGEIEKVEAITELVDDICGLPD